jgi:EmrB/QacA subfamily drug resistance transporter
MGLEMRRHLIFFTAGLGLLMYSIDSTVIAVALPNFIKDFETSVLWAAWTISIYLIAITTVMPLAGSLSDSFGRKKIFLISLIIFTASSVACGLAPNIYTLVGFRFLQGIGGASILPTAAGIVSENFPEQRERAIGLFTSIFPIGGIIGPNLGGWMVSQYSWRYIFYINLPIGIVLIVLIMILLKDSRVSSHRPIDFLGASFFSGTVIFLMLGFNIIGESLSRSSLVLATGFFFLSFAFIFLLLRQEAKASAPVLDFTLLKSKPFLAANLYNLMIGAGVFAVFSFVPLYATSVHSLSTLASGMILTPRSLGVIPASTLISFLLKRWGYRWPMIAGMIVISLATILLSQGLPFWRSLGVQLGIAEILALLAMVAGIGMGIAFPAANNACIELMPEKIVTITGLRGMFRTIGGALGVSIITVILHVCSNPAKGFMITFISFGLGLLLSIPLVFLMPAGKGRTNQSQVR